MKRVKAANNDSRLAKYQTIQTVFWLVVLTVIFGILFACFSTVECITSLQQYAAFFYDVIVVWKKFQ